MVGEEGKNKKRIEVYNDINYLKLTKFFLPQVSKYYAKVNETEIELRRSNFKSCIHPLAMILEEHTLIF